MGARYEPFPNPSLKGGELRKAKSGRVKIILE